MAEAATVTPIRGMRVVVDETTNQRFREVLERTKGVVFTPLRRAWGFLKTLAGRAASSAPVRGALNLVRRGLGIVRSLADRLGRSGTIAAAVGAATSRNGQAAIAATGRFLLKGVALTVDAAASAVQHVLSVVPGPTRWVSHQIARFRTSWGGWMLSIGTWKGWKKAQTKLDPAKLWVQRVRAFALSWAFRQLVRSFIANRWLGLLIMVPFNLLVTPEADTTRLQSEMRTWTQAQTNRRRDSAVWVTPNGASAAAGDAAAEAAVLADKAYRQITDGTIAFFAKEGHFPNEAAVIKALDLTVRTQFKKLLHGQQANSACRDFSREMAIEFHKGVTDETSVYNNLSSPELVTEVRAQAERAVAAHSQPVAARR